uniref:Putative pleiotropic drug resistance ABC transporter n=1 Tax=Moniliophthora roreri TaxID=221103 RepID=A0A0W0F1J3_MONRR
MPSATALASFICYTLIAGQRLTVSTAFTAIALFSQLQGPMTEIPEKLFALLHAYVSMQRIEQFLEEDEVPEWASTLASSTLADNDGHIGFSNATFQWQASPKSDIPDSFQLGPLDVVFPEGKLTLISGPTGSGKSAVLAALLGEMYCVSGRVLIDKSNHQVAYCGLEHATIRDNIIFASNYGYDEERYNAVLEACALKRDLDVFAAGDMTEIGEKGITLSGGQKARIALARAVYSQAKCILLDDPLAAVDMHTAQHLVEKCFSGELMHRRTVLLVTHHISLVLPISSYLVELSHGSVIKQGPIESFSQNELRKVIETEDEPFVMEDKATTSEPLENEADMEKDTLKSRSDVDGKLVEVEARAEGRVSMVTYLTYIRAAGSWSWILTFALMLLIRGINIGNQFFLAAWGEAYETSYHTVFRAFVTTSVGYPWENFPSPEIDVIPVFAPIALFIAWLYIRLAPPYIQASRDLRRLESVSLSPTFAGFDELLRGITHVRAFGMESRYQNAFYGKVDKFQSFDHVYVCAFNSLALFELLRGLPIQWLVNCWLRWRYDCLGSVVVYATTVFSLWMGIKNGATAVVIVQAGIFAEASRQLVRVAAQLELDFNSVERVTEYLGIPQEAPAIIDTKRPPAWWPSSSGPLVVDNLSVRYAPHLPTVLRDLTFTVKPCEKIGVVGRTGSGKSTLALSLLRMIEPLSGKIFIDGIDISTIGLGDLRTRITIVSQDVSLFSGTLRTNLDPLGDNSDEEVIEIMRRCHLPSVLNHKGDVDERTLLDLPISQGSLSGDEATSQIDTQLDENIQRTIREELSGAIVITIAHRLKTVIDYDRILVLDDGEIAEFGSPRELLQKSGGLFREMCRRSPDWPIFASLAT